ncbi:unnamed protein product [Fraxinus pennsylvanica]|uniref:AT-hook motif nuclear-localized protein n=1 Tax=Fraxinus pennsylvanica TaxID=56036 RepID=A0AAD2DTK0_9LAMI|nr:unnamed protein product [Fraxinus pennsylvanica]
MVRVCESRSTLISPNPLKEGQFYILSLSGSFKLLEVGNQKSRTGGLSVTLSGCDGRVLGGSVAGPLIAASPIQIVVTSFKAYESEGKKSDNSMETSFALQVSAGGATGASSSTSNVAFSEFSGGPANPKAGTKYIPQGTSGMAGN